MRASDIKVGGVYAREGKAGAYIRKVTSSGEAKAPHWHRLHGRLDVVGYLEIRPNGYTTSSPDFTTVGAFARWAEREVSA
jgi:hypothetical protein